MKETEFQTKVTKINEWGCELLHHYPYYAELTAKLIRWSMAKDLIPTMEHKYIYFDELDFAGKMGRSKN